MVKLERDAKMEFGLEDRTNKKSVNDIMLKYGFRFNRNSVHSSRTIMLDELSLLIESVPNPVDTQQFVDSIRNENCLGKRSDKTRKLTSEHLIELYSLDPHIPIFRNLLFFWERDKDARPMLALLCAVCRDSMLRSTFKIIQSVPENEVLKRETMEDYIDSLEPDRFSKATLKSMAQNINSSWTKGGLLKGRAKKTRSKTNATPASVAFALYLGYLGGVRGPELFETDYIKMTDCNKERAIELAEIASHRGWINFKKIGNVMEIVFPNMITKEEAEWLYEQN